VRQRVARTSAAPGKTRLANIYRVVRGGAAPLYLVDLPGYGYARGDRRELDAITREYFEVRLKPDATAILIVDARHPGLESDLAAWKWLSQTVATCGIVVTKLDKLSRAQRQRAIARFEAVFHHPVAAVSADTGEGLEDLWRLIDRLTKPG
jgi:GTP-binding protein